MIEEHIIRNIEENDKNFLIEVLNLEIAKISKIVSNYLQYEEVKRYLSISATISIIDREKFNQPERRKELKQKQQEILEKYQEVEKFVESLPQEEQLGGKIVTRALQEPVRQIAINAGLEPAVILEKVKASPVGVGFDAGKEEYVDMKKAGIVDPTKVSRSALQNAASVASMILTTESLVTDKKEPKDCNCGAHNDQDVGGMY